MDTPDPAVVSFAECVRRYGEWIENIGEANNESLLAGHKILSELQFGALSLPSIEPNDSSRDFDVDNWKTIRDRLAEFPVEGYFKVFDVFAPGEAPVFCTIADDLADIYADLKEGLAYYDDRDFIEATWHWRFTYLIHWGRHLTGAQTAIHQYLSDVLV